MREEEEERRKKRETSTDRIVKPVTEHEFLLKIAANQSIKKRKKKINLKRN
jgi:hypothetical protein